MDSINKLQYKILKKHQVSKGMYVVLCQMELPTTHLVALCDEMNILESQVFICDAKYANRAYKSKRIQMYSYKNN